MAGEVAKVSRRRRVVAVLLSLVIPGCGHAVLGRWRRGLAWVLGIIVIQGTLLLTGVAGVLLALMGQAVTLVDAALVRPSLRGVPRTGVAVGLGLAFWLAGVMTAQLNRRLIVEPFRVPSASMEPTLLPGDQFMVDRTVAAPWKRRPLERGEVIVFLAPDDPNRTYVKRLVALGGDVVAMRQGQLVLNGQPVSWGAAEPCEPDEVASPEGTRCERYPEQLGQHVYRVNFDPDAAGREFFPRSDEGCPRNMEPRGDGCYVPPGTLFVLGDNRFASYDSRIWGVIPEDSVKGVAAFIHASLSPEWQVRWTRFNLPVP